MLRVSRRKFPRLIVSRSSLAGAIARIPARSARIEPETRRIVSIAADTIAVSKRVLPSPRVFIRQSGIYATIVLDRSNL